MAKYFLMHKDVRCGEMQYDPDGDRITSYRDFKTGQSPFMGQADYAKIQKWWLMRAVPASRAALRDILRVSGCVNAGNYLAKNLALSMTDAYWLCPEGLNLSYDMVKLANFAALHGGKVPYHNATSYDPNASLGGQMDKYWDLSEAVPTLVKEGYRFYGQQPANEAFATWLHERQGAGIPFVKYRVSASEDRGLLCKCQAFTSEKTEFVPAYEVIESRKPRNDISLYGSYIETCVSAGIDRDAIQGFMDYQTLTDFIISNTDEHLLNFGILRDPDTMQYIGPAPIFDSGNSMFHADARKTPYTRAELLGREITSFYKSEEHLLKKVQDKNIVKMDLLPDPAEAKEFYIAYGLPEWKADVISKNYATKLALAKEFQQGKTISLYKEKQKEKAAKHDTKTQAYTCGQEFVMLCGIPGSGKTQAAETLLRQYEANGLRITDSRNLVPLDEVLGKTQYLVDSARLMAEARPKTGYQQSAVMVSLNDVRDEARSAGEYNDFAFLLAKLRIKTALLSGVSVIYDAANLKKDTREQFLQIAREAGISNTKLYVLDVPPEHSSDTGIDRDILQEMYRSFSEEYPGLNEGWSEIRKAEWKNKTIDR